MKFKGITRTEAPMGSRLPTVHVSCYHLGLLPIIILITGVFYSFVSATHPASNRILNTAASGRLGRLRILFRLLCHPPHVRILLSFTLAGNILKGTRIIPLSGLPIDQFIAFVDANPERKRKPLKGIIWWFRGFWPD